MTCPTKTTHTDDNDHDKPAFGLGTTIILPEDDDPDDDGGHAWAFRMFASESAKPTTTQPPARPEGCCT